jgi:hypothetical protein
MPTVDKTDNMIAEALNRLAETQAQLAALQARDRKRDLSYDDYLERQPKRVMPFQLYQNGIQVFVEQLTDAQLALLPKLQAGRFFDRKIHVYRDATPDRGWHIDWPRKSMSDRMAIAQYGRDLTEILQRLITEKPDLS